MANMFDTSGLSGGGSETPTSIKLKYESNPDTNAYTDDEKADVATIKQLREEIDSLKSLLSTGGVINGDLQIVGDIHAQRFFKDEEADK